MLVHIREVVMLPAYTPYPRYGRVVKIDEAGAVHVTTVQCGDPRCVAEHRHGDQVWPAVAICSARAYQGRAGWEAGRKSSPNAPTS